MSTVITGEIPNPNVDPDEICRVNGVAPLYGNQKMESIYDFVKRYTKSQRRRAEKTFPDNRTLDLRTTFTGILDSIDEYLDDMCSPYAPVEPEGDDSGGTPGSDLKQIKGVGKATAQKFSEGGIETVDEVKTLSLEEMQELGISKSLATRIQKSLGIYEEEADDTDVTEAETQETQEVVNRERAGPVRATGNLGIDQILKITTPDNPTYQPSEVYQNFSELSNEGSANYDLVREDLQSYVTGITRGWTNKNKDTFFKYLVSQTDECDLDIWNSVDYFKQNKPTSARVAARYWLACMNPDGFNQVSSELIRSDTTPPEARAVATSRAENIPEDELDEGDLLKL